MDLTGTKAESTEIELPQVQQELPEILPEGITKAEVIPEKAPQSEIAQQSEQLLLNHFQKAHIAQRFSKPPDRLPSSWPELKGNLKKGRCSGVN